MAVTKQAHVAGAPWTITQVTDAVRDAFIGAGLMTAWHDSFTSGGREHRVLEIIYNGSKTYGKTYYWFTFDGTGIWVRTSTGWNTTSKIPSGPGVTGTQFVDWYDTNTSQLPTSGAAYTLLAVSTSINFSITRYTTSGRSFFVLRTGTTYQTFTIDPPSTGFRTFYDLNLGYHSGIYRILAQNSRISINSVHRHRRDLLLGSSINGGSGGATEVTCANYCIPLNFGIQTSETYPNSGFALPGWTTAANPSAGSNFNPVFNGIRLTSIHSTDLPTDFGISSIKNSNILAIQDNATVSAGVEEYEILAFSNQGEVNSITSNPVFLARTVG
jgi:hypothetical protein